MGRIIGKNIVGKIGNLVYRRGRKGMTIISAKAKNVRQTAETKKSAKFFGRVANVAKIVRLETDWLGQQDMTLMTRLNKEMLPIFKACYSKESETFDFSNTYFDHLNGIEFNTSSLLRAYLWKLPVFEHSSDHLKITIPELSAGSSLAFPGSASLCRLSMQPLQFDLNDGRLQVMPRMIHDIAVDQGIVPAQDFHLDLTPGTLCMVVMGLQYFSKDSGMFFSLRTEDFSPAALLYAMWNEGVFAEQISESFVTKNEDGGMTGKTVHYWEKQYQPFPIRK